MTVIMDEKNTIVQRTCPICRETFEISIPTDDYINWQNGELIQNAMPYLSPSNREFLISGICGNCQEKIFGGDEE